MENKKKQSRSSIEFGKRMNWEPGDLILLNTKSKKTKPQIKSSTKQKKGTK